MLRRWHLLGLIGPLVSGVLLAQDAGDAVVRRPTFARVLDRNGQPLASAVVTFAGSLPHLGSEIGFRDVQQVASDARGRAHAKLDPRLCYVAWATSAKDAQDRQALSPVHGYFSSGALFDLHCAGPTPPMRYEVNGAAAWAHRGPLRFVLLARVPGPEIDLGLDERGRVVAPPSPEPRIEVRLADGQPLLQTNPGEPAIVIPPPQQLRIRVTDEAGVALPGALIKHRVARLPTWSPDGIQGVAEDRVRVLGITDAEGRATVEVPYDEPPLQHNNHGDMLLVASAAGRADVFGGIKNRVYYENDRKTAAIADGELQFKLPKVEPLRGCCRSMPAGSIAHLTAVCKLFLDRSSYSHDTRAFVAPIGIDGQFSFDTLPAELHSCRLTIVPPESDSRPLLLFPAQADRTLPSEALPLEVPATTPLFVDVELAVTDPTGGPARGVVAFLVPGDLRGILMRDSLVRLTLDARGAATLRVTPGKWILIVQSDAGWVAHADDFDHAGMGVNLTMTALETMHVELRDQAGKPIQNAALQSRGTTTRGSSDPVETVLQSLRTLTRTQWGMLRTDELGRMTIPFVPVPGMTQRLALSFQGGTSSDFELKADEKWVPVGVR